MGTACNKIQKNQKPQELASNFINPKIPSNLSMNGSNSKAAIPMLQQPQLNSLVLEEKPKSATIKTKDIQGEYLFSFVNYLI